MRKIENKECYVAFLDILGFKELMGEKDSTKLIRGVFDTIISGANFVSRDIKETYGPQYSYLAELVELRIMSDSIVIAIPENTQGSLDFIIKCCSFFQGELSAKNILLRGGIAKGLFNFDENTMFGEALIKAYFLENTVAKYPRVIISSQIEGIKEFSLTNKLVEYSETEFLYYVNYYKYVSPNLKGFLEESIVLNELNNKVKEKYVWLLNYLEKNKQ